eukprot:15104561-Alexandrium_andersonii.AAC.1
MGVTGCSACTLLARALPLQLFMISHLILASPSSLCTACPEMDPTLPHVVQSCVWACMRTWAAALLAFFEVCPARCSLDWRPGVLKSVHLSRALVPLAAPLPRGPGNLCPIGMSRTLALGS